MIIYRHLTKQSKINVVCPPLIPGIERVTSMNVLGVILDDKLSFKQHLEQNVLSKAASSLYALKVLRSKGLEGQQLWDVTSQTLVARMLYASQAWWGFVNDEASRGRLEAIINKLRRQKYLPVEYNTFYDLCNRADQVLFKSPTKRQTCSESPTPS